MPDTTGRLAHRWVHQRLRERDIVRDTATAQRGILRGFAAFAPDDPSKITKRTIQRWYGSIQHLEEGTRRNRWSVVRCFLQWLVDERRLRRHPMTGMKAPKVPKPLHRNLSRDQILDLLDACADPRDRIIVVLGHQLGLRRAEIAGLEIGSLNLHTQTVTVLGKGNKRRVVALTTTAMVELHAYMAWAGIRSGPLLRLPKYPNRGLQPVWVGRRMAEIAYAAGVKARPRDGVGTHSLRHTCATEMHDDGADLTIIRDMLGHESLATTEIYVKGLGVERMREAMEGRGYTEVADHRPLEREGVVLPLRKTRAVQWPPGEAAA